MKREWDWSAEYALILNIVVGLFFFVVVFPAFGISLGVWNVLVGVVGQLFWMTIIQIVRRRK